MIKIMTKDTIIMKLNSVCQALNNVTVSGVQNMANLAGCYSILQEIVNELMSEENSDGE